MPSFFTIKLVLNGHEDKLSNLIIDSILVEYIGVETPEILKIQ